MIYLILATVFSLVFIVWDLKWNQDPLSPLIWTLFFYLMVYIFPGFLQEWVSSNAQMRVFELYPFGQYRKLFLETPALALLNYVLGFGLSYLLSLSVLRSHKMKTFDLQIEKKEWLKRLNYLGILGSVVLLHLLKYDEPYFHMKGFGWANWLVNIFGFVIGFISLTQKETRKWGMVNLFLAIVIYLFVLDRKSNSLEVMLGMAIIFINFRKVWSFKRFLVGIILVVLLLIGKYLHQWKYYDQYMPPGTNTVTNKVKLLVGGEIGRFDLVASIFQVHTPSKTYDPTIFLRKIPFSGYLPLIKEQNKKYGEISEIWLYGKKRYQFGGIPIMELHEIYFIFNSHLGIFLLMMLMGVLWAILYESTLRLSASGSTVPIAVYALFWLGNCQAMVPEVLFTSLALFFILVLGKIKLVELRPEA